MFFNIFFIGVAAICLGCAFYNLLTSNYLLEKLRLTEIRCVDYEEKYLTMYLKNDKVRIFIQDFMNMDIANLSNDEAFRLKQNILKRIQEE